MRLENANLLVVDDSESVREVMLELLHDAGITHIDQAMDGDEALEKFQANRYDMVITDWNMPHMSGIDLLKSIRQGDGRRDTPVLIMSGDVTTQRVVEALEAGADGFIAKPFVTPALPEKVLRIVRTLPPVAESASVSHVLGGGVGTSATTPPLAGTQASSLPQTGR